MLCGFACLGLITVLLFFHVIRNPFNSNNIRRNPELFYLVSGSSLLFLITGLSGYQANFIQLGLDQLLEAPSEYLGLFVHWVEWTTMLGFFLIKPIFFLLSACKDAVPIHHTVLSLAPFFFAMLLLVLIFSCWKRHWFYSEPGQNNPYKMVFQVLNFTRKNKYPLQRSAFTYADDEEPTRIDFAKEKYGGPFKTEQVEDVKTFFRILAILLVLGPAFFLEIPLGPVFAIYTNHTGKYELTNNTGMPPECSWRPLLKDMAVLRSLASVLLFPIYIWLIYSVLRRCIPRTIIRIWVGEILLASGMVAMFLIDLSGHVKHYRSHHQAAACMFVFNDHNHSFKLELPWAVNLMPALLMQAGITLVITTTFEFISAQSPHSMKGLLIGMFYAIRGTFKFLGAISILPFSVKAIWTSNYMKKHVPSVTNCGFGYFLLNLVVGFTGLVLFTVAARRYHYRERDDPPYNQTTVETVWANQ